MRVQGRPISIDLKDYLAIRSDRAPKIVAIVAGQAQNERLHWITGKKRAELAPKQAREAPGKDDRACSADQNAGTWGTCLVRGTHTPAPVDYAFASASLT